MVKYLGKLINVDEAIEKTVKAINRIDLRVVEKDVFNSLGYILAEDVYASTDQPPFDRSAVDGYAVISTDTYGASYTNPVKLKIVGIMEPGDDPSKVCVKRGEAVYVSTGSPLPLNSDAVVMHEDAEAVDNYVYVYKPVPKYGNVSKKGEDYRAGELLVGKNTVLKPWDLGFIASNGIRYVKVFEKIRIGILCVGDEIAEPGEEISGGRLYNSTGVLVKNYLDAISFVESKYYGVVEDDKDKIFSVLEEMARENHVMVTTGGTGVSDNDVLRDVVDENGVFIFRGVAMRPGRPTSFALMFGKPLLMLSGYPVGAWTGLEALFTPILYRVLGLKLPTKPLVRAKLMRKVPNRVGYRSYIRVKLVEKNGEIIAEPLMLKGSGVLSSLVRSDGYIIVPENVEGFESETLVDVIIKT